MHLRPLLCGVLMSVSAYSAFAADCTLKKVASFDATIQSGKLTIKAKIDDRPVNAVLDTGAPFNMIDNKLVEELKLPTNYGTIHGVDMAGHVTHISALAHKVALSDDFVAKNVNFLIGGRDSANGSFWADALFGTNFLEAQDLELDLAHGKVNIFLSDHCAGQGVYWAHEYVPIPIRVQDQTDFQNRGGFIFEEGHIYIPVTLDGVQTFALLDTGSSLSLVDKVLAEGRLNVPTDGGKDKPDGYITSGSGARLPFYKHTFGTFDIGGIAFHNTELAVMANTFTHHAKRNDDVMNAHVAMPSTQPVDAPITFGLQHIAKLRMYFSFREKMLYVTPANAQ